MGRVLLIEPDKPLAAAYVAALQQADHLVDHATAAQAAIYAADEALPDVVVLEIQLAAHSGIEFLYEFRSYTEWQHIPVIIVSHVPSHELLKSSRMLREQLGVRAYYYKPQLRLSQLVRAVEEVLPAVAAPTPVVATIAAAVA